MQRPRGAAGTVAADGQGGVQALKVPAGSQGATAGGGGGVDGLRLGVGFGISRSPQEVGQH